MAPAATDTVTVEEANAVLANAEQLFDTTAVEAAIGAMAGAITAALRGTHPLVMPVMTGGIILAGKLIPQLDFPLELDYLHAARYRDTTAGGELRWLRKPDKSLAGRTVLLIDDILDEGVTLAAIVEACRSEGASRVLTAVLTEKALPGPKPLPHADFTGLSVPDRYVFGYGMDYHGHHRNLPGIYALKE